MSQHKSELGLYMWSTGYAVKGKLDESVCAELLREMAEAIGMKVDGLHMACWKFPAFGVGGDGITMIQPIVSSFLGADTWLEHEGGYLFINSCCPYSAHKIKGVIEARGLKVVMIDTMTLTLNGFLKEHPSCQPGTSTK